MKHRSQFRKALCLILAVVSLYSAASLPAYADSRGSFNATTGDLLTLVGQGGGDGSVTCNYCQGVRVTLIDAQDGTPVPSNREGNATSFDIGGAWVYNGSVLGGAGFMGGNTSTGLSKYDYMYGDYTDIGIPNLDLDHPNFRERYNAWHDLYASGSSNFPNYKTTFDSTSYDSLNADGRLDEFSPAGKITTNKFFTTDSGPDGGWATGQTGEKRYTSGMNRGQPAAMPVVMNNPNRGAQIVVNAVKNWFTAEIDKYNGTWLSDPENNDPVIFILAQYWALKGTGSDKKLENYYEFASGKYDLMVEPLTDFFFKVSADYGIYYALTATDIAVMGLGYPAVSRYSTQTLYNIPNSALLEYEEEYGQRIYYLQTTKDPSTDGELKMHKPVDIFQTMGMWMIHFAEGLSDTATVLCFDLAKAQPGDDTAGLIATGSVKMNGGKLKPDNLTTYISGLNAACSGITTTSDMHTWSYDKTTLSLTNKLAKKPIEEVMAATSAARSSAVTALKALSDKYLTFATIKLANVPTMSSLSLQPGVKEGLEGYKFRFALGEDILSKKLSNTIGIAEDDASKSVQLVTVHGDLKPVLRLYFAAETEYYVKIRVDGKIDDSLTYTVPATAGDVINEEDVDTSRVPSGYYVKSMVRSDPDDYLEKPLPLVVDQTAWKNVIIIDCVKPQYTVKVRVNGTIDETLTRDYPAKLGTVIKDKDVDTSIVPTGYKIEGIENTPLTVGKDISKNLIIIDCTCAGYIVKIRLNGTIYESLTTLYDAGLGSVIKKSQVDTSKVPEGFTIRNIENVPLTVSSDMSKNIIIIDAITTGYYVKIIVDGKIVVPPNELFPTPPGEKITLENVDASKVPPDAVIDEVQNVPMVIDSTPDDNIIVIICHTRPKQCEYTIEYYLDGLFHEATTEDGAYGEVITNPPYKGYPGYSLNKITGTPLTLVNNTGVIRVYFTRNVEPAVPTLNALLFADEYLTQIPSRARPTEKSGYGVYSLVYVDMASYLNATTTYTWSVANPSGCTSNKTTTASVTVPSYQKPGQPGVKIGPENVTVKATWLEGTKIVNGKAVLDQNGHSVTVTMEYDAAHSTATRWAYRLPKNPSSSKGYAKAYIPVNTPDGQNTWGISYAVSLNYAAPAYTTVARSMYCNQTNAAHERYRTEQRTGYRLVPVTREDGSPSYAVQAYTYNVWVFDGYYNHLIRYQDLIEKYENKTMTSNMVAYLSIKGNMYEDDFSGDRK